MCVQLVAGSPGPAVAQQEQRFHLRERCRSRCRPSSPPKCRPSPTVASLAPPATATPTCRCVAPTAAFSETRGLGQRAKWEGNREHTETHMHARGSVIRHILNDHANASVTSAPPSMSNIRLTPFTLLIHLPLGAVGTSYTRDSGLRALVPLSTRLDHFKSAAGRGHRDQGLQSCRLVHAVKLPSSSRRLGHARTYTHAHMHTYAHARAVHTSHVLAHVTIYKSVDFRHKPRHPERGQY
jgi:hypothetical protein